MAARSSLRLALYAKGERGDSETRYYPTVLLRGVLREDGLWTSMAMVVRAWLLHGPLSDHKETKESFSSSSSSSSFFSAVETRDKRLVSATRRKKRNVGGGKKEIPSD